ncbi:MAG: hypothetical protein DME26_12385 [Verrucomicrobia bacterium]|nr:MAG: hypothetical protein DME26_12385 [Verrucomicrobiota bacterium]
MACEFDKSPNEPKKNISRPAELQSGLKQSGRRREKADSEVNTRFATPFPWFHPDRSRSLNEEQH